MGIRMWKWKAALLHGLVLIFIGYLSSSEGYDYDYEEQIDSWGRCPWIRNMLKNGRVRVRSRGRIAKFVCKSGYELVGKKFATCVRGRWNNPLPMCIAKGCPKITAIANGVVTEKYKGAQLTFNCNPGYSLQGDTSIFCDGSQWDKSAPSCEVATLQPQKSCDFEDPDLCGWNHDPNHDFDWRRHQFNTPSGHVGTGPSYDHTFGKGKAGYYMYEETSAPRNINDTSRLFSPVYSSNNSPGCFVFWYHMYGSTIGRLRIYIKPESHVFVELTPVWEKSGDQGNQWLRGNVSIPSINENFQIVIEGIRGASYLGDTAIDDVSLVKADCSSLDSFNATEGEEASGDSCRGRCHEQDNSTSCGCTDACESANTCCSDYAKLCSGGNEPPSGENETIAGKPETDGTPEDKVGTDYTVTKPLLSTEFVTLLQQSSTVTKNNNKQSSTQVPTSTFTTPSASTISVGMNSSTGGTTMSAASPTVPEVHIPVSRKASESVNTTTQTTRNFTNPEITTVKGTIGTSIVPVSTTQTPTTTSSATPETYTLPPTKSPMTTVTKTLSIASTTAVSNLTSVVPGITIISSTTSAPTPAITNTTTKPVIFMSSESSRVTTDTTTKTTPPTTKFVSIIATVPSTFSTAINTPTSSQASTPEGVKPTSKSTISTTGIPTTSQVTNSRTTKTTTTVKSIPSSSSTTVTTPTTTKSTKIPLNTVIPYRPIPRKTTLAPVSSTTVRPIFRSTRTTNSVSLLYTAKFQATTLDSLSGGSHELKSAKTNSRNVIGASIGVITVVCLIGGVTFVFLRRRRQKLDKLHGDSIRFLPDNDVIEYSEASATDPLFQ